MGVVFFHILCYDYVPGKEPGPGSWKLAKYEIVISQGIRDVWDLLHRSLGAKQYFLQYTFLPEARLWLVQYESVVSAIWHIFYLVQQHSNGILD